MQYSNESQVTVVLQLLVYFISANFCQEAISSIKENIRPRQ